MNTYANDERFDLSADDLERFLDKVEKDSDTGCWNWIAALDKKGGYGKFWYDGGVRRAHRVSFEHFKELKADYILDHMCNNPQCVNPFHLEPSTPRDNVLRSERSVSGINARKTQCKNGHPYDKIYINPQNNSFRYCSQCKRNDSRRYAQKQRELKKGLK